MQQFLMMMMIIIIIFFFFLPSVSIPEGGLKIDKNKLKGYDTQLLLLLLL